MALALVKSIIKPAFSSKVFFCPSCMLSRQLSTTPTIMFRQSQVRAQEDTGPIKFSQSAAYNLNPLTANAKQREETPWFQGPLIVFSMTACLIYFTILREENDLDNQLSGRLYDRVDGLERQDLITTIKRNEEKGEDTTALRERLREVLLEEEEKKALLEEEN